MNVYANNDKLNYSEHWILRRGIESVAFVYHNFTLFFQKKCQKNSKCHTTSQHIEIKIQGA